MICFQAQTVWVPGVQDAHTTAHMHIQGTCGCSGHWVSWQLWKWAEFALLKSSRGLLMPLVLVIEMEVYRFGGEGSVTVMFSSIISPNVLSVHKSGFRKMIGSEGYYRWSIDEFLAECAAHVSVWWGKEGWPEGVSPWGGKSEGHVLVPGSFLSPCFLARLRWVAFLLHAFPRWCLCLIGSWPWTDFLQPWAKLNLAFCKLWGLGIMSQQWIIWLA